MNSITQKFELHYYLKDNSHAMNAFVRNKAEKDFLEAVKRIGDLLDSELKSYDKCIASLSREVSRREFNGGF